MCLQWSCLKAVSVPTFVSNIGRPAGLHRNERSCQVYVHVCHRGQYKALSIGRLVQFCASWRKFLSVGYDHVFTLDHTQSQAVS